MTPMPRLSAFLTITIFLTGVAFADVNQAMLDRVASGDITEAKASWWGFDPEDATEALQAAINSGVAKLTVDNTGQPWVVRPIQLASDQEITFEKGVEVVAKRGEFKGTGDSLFTASNKTNITLTGYGATFRMHRSDYDNPELYKKAEWRHTLSIRSSSNVKVYGLTLLESGGDGIYLGVATRGVTNTDIHIKDVVCESHYRQGISVISAENLLIEDTIMRNTKGTPPQAGIDFEPNHASERLANVVMRNCLSENNSGSGYVLYLRPLKATSEPISVRFENCRAINNYGTGAGIINNNLPADAVTGSVVFSDCTLEGGTRSAITVDSNPPSGLDIRFEEVTIINPSVDEPAMSPIQFLNRTDSEQPVGGVTFTNVRLQDAVDRNPMGYLDSAGGLPLEAITGTLIAVHGDTEEHLTLTPELLDRWMPVEAIKRIPRLPLDLSGLQPHDDTVPKNGYGFGFAKLRRNGEFALYATAGDEVRLVMHYWPVGSNSGKDVPVIVTAPTGKTAHRVEIPIGSESDVHFTAPETGVYRISANPDINRLALTQSSHPVNIIAEGAPLRLIHAGGSYFFWVPAGTTEFAVRVTGEGSGEAIRAALINPEGEVVEEVDNLVALHQFAMTQPEDSPGAPWTIRLSKPSTRPWEDHSVDLRGVPPLFAPSAEALLVPAK